MSNKNFINIIDLGSSKIRLSVFDVNLKNNFSNSILLDYEKDNSNHFYELNEIVREAEKSISNHIQDVVLMLDSSEIFIIDISLKKNLDKKNKINNIFETMIMEINQIINKYYLNYKILHIIVDQCIIDNKIYSELPKFLNNTDNLKIDFKLICFPKNFINEINERFKKNNLNVINFICSSYVKTSNYITKINKSKVSFLEIGFKRTSFIFYENNALKLIHSVPVGSFHITKDISNIFKITFNEAEQIKKLFNQSETEFSYQNNDYNNRLIFKEIISKNIPIEKLKQVILYRVQEIIDLSFKKTNIKKFNFKEADLFLVGGGSKLFNNNSFYLEDKFDFKSINFFSESDDIICDTGAKYYLSETKLPEVQSKKQGIFEKFFNFFDK